MKRLRLSALALSASFLIISVAEANDRHWTVAAVSGDVQVRAEFETRTPVAGMRISPSETIQTGADGRVTLVRDANSIAAYENSRFQVRAPRNGSILTRVLQDAGQLLFQVEKRAGRHFEVETPYLVAGVKGTTFGIDVAGRNASVSVVEGLVGVSDPETGEEVDVAAGQTAHWRRNDRRRTCRRNRHVDIEEVERARLAGLRSAVDANVDQKPARSLPLTGIERRSS